METQEWGLDGHVADFLLCFEQAFFVLLPVDHSVFVHEAFAVLLILLPEPLEPPVLRPVVLDAEAISQPCVSVTYRT